MTRKLVWIPSLPVTLVARELEIFWLSMYSVRSYLWSALSLSLSSSSFFFSHSFFALWYQFNIKFTISLWEQPSNTFFGLLLFLLSVNYCSWLLVCGQCKHSMQRRRNFEFGKLCFFLSNLLIYSTVVNASSMSLSSIKINDIIFSNFVGYLQILIFAALYMFNGPC